MKPFDKLGHILFVLNNVSCEPKQMFKNNRSKIPCLILKVHARIVIHLF